MAPVVVVHETVTVGVPLVLGADAPASLFSVVFEDDGSTGYLYGLDKSRGDNQIVDALHIYNVESVADKQLPSTVQIAWSTDSLKALLSINEYPHAVFDFAAKRGYCRTGFPSPDRNWTAHSHEWSDVAMSLFK